MTTPKAPIHHPQGSPLQGAGTSQARALQLKDDFLDGELAIFSPHPRSQQLGFTPSAHSIRRIVVLECLFARAHSHVRSTVQPTFFNLRVTTRSRPWLQASFASQNARLCFGLGACRGHPCQRFAL